MLKPFNRHILPVLLLLLLPALVTAQKKPDISSLLNKLPVLPDDTGKVNLYIKISDVYAGNKQYDDALKYASNGLVIADKLHWEKGIMETSYRAGRAYRSKSDEKNSILYFKRSLSSANKLGNVSLKEKLYRYLGDCYISLDDYKTALSYVSTGISLYKDKDTSETHVVLLCLGGNCYQYFADYHHAFDLFLQAKKLADHGTNNHAKAILYNYMGRIYEDVHEYKEALNYKLAALKLYRLSQQKSSILNILVNTASTYESLKDYDNAIRCEQEALTIVNGLKNDDFRAVLLNNLSWIYYLKKNYSRAYLLAKESLELKQGDNNKFYTMSTMGAIVKDLPDSLLRRFGIGPRNKYRLALRYLIASNQLAIKYAGAEVERENFQNMSMIYDSLGNFKQSAETYKQFIAFRDSLYNEDKKKDFVKKELEYDFGKKEDSLKYQQVLTNTKLKAKQAQLYYFIGGLVLLLALISFIGVNYLNQKKANKLITEANNALNEQSEEIMAQRDQLSETLDQLKNSQKQLIQSEKMASLGELTAGIAHEIQNPLNFVNNFSEVSAELVDELEEGLNTGNMAEIKSITADLRQNLYKISHHGKRADGIVKGMLEHSRASTGQKEPTDLNKLTDEYLRLSYYGLKVKDASFDAELTTYLDPELPVLNIIPQDIGRVLLNLLNNAFYAVNQKTKTAGPNYKPGISVTTSFNNNHVRIMIKDNGNGIPENIKDKIMQPFFTTKPTGEGTGLGLSLSYDIVVKGHGGNLIVNTMDNNFTEVIVELPANT